DHVGAQLDLGEQADAVRRRPALLVQQAVAGQAGGGGVPFLVGPPARLLHGLPLEVVAAAQDQDRATVQARRDQRRHVTVAAVLAQDRGGVPQRLHRIVRPGQRGVRGRERPARGRHRQGGGAAEGNDLL